MMVLIDTCLPTEFNTSNTYLDPTSEWKRDR